MSPSTLTHGNAATKEIPLTQGKVALVDADDFDFLMQWKWRAERKGNKWYASTYYNGKGVGMHRILLGLTSSKIFGDHIDGDGLNNRRSNLRSATLYQNLQNTSCHVDSKYGYKGVDRRSPNQWRARIQIYGKTIYLGSFKTLELAAQAYNEAAIKYHGEFARLNKIDFQTVAASSDTMHRLMTNEAPAGTQGITQTYSRRMSSLQTSVNDSDNYKSIKNRIA